jgi:hypothetical protein
MLVQELLNTTTHSIKLFSFIDTRGRTVTSFFQAIKKPDISLGAFDTFSQAEYAIKLTEKLKIWPVTFKD